MAHKPAYIDTQNFGLDDLFYADELTMTRPFPLHRHSFVELHYFSGGRGTEKINGVAYPVEEGCMTLKMPWHIHELLPDREHPLRISKCSFRMCVLEDNGLMQSVSVPLAQSYDCCPAVQIPPAERPVVSMIFSQLAEERRHIYPLKEEQMASLMIQLLVFFLRHASPSAGETVGDVAQNALRLMNLRCREPDLTCEKIAEAVHYSSSQLQRMLRDEFGMTFGELLREIRIRNACGLLKTTDYPSESIALWSGYTSRDGFYQAFTADQDMTPAEYRKRFSVSDRQAIVKVLSSSQLYAKIIYYLHRNHQEQVTLADAAEYFGYSESYLKRILKEQGTGFSRLLERIRIYHAKQLLLGTALNVDAVARETGFSSPETFYRVFKKHTGKTPVEFRRSGESSGICPPAGSESGSTSTPAEPISKDAYTPAEPIFKDASTPAGSENG